MVLEFCKYEGSDKIVRAFCRTELELTFLPTPRVFEVGNTYSPAFTDAIRRALLSRSEKVGITKAGVPVNKPV